MKVNELKAKLDMVKDELKSRFKVKSLFVFGSVALGHDKKSSDIDLIVEFSADDVSLFDLIDLKIYLESLLKRKVDLLTRDTIGAWMQAEVNEQSIRVA